MKRIMLLLALCFLPLFGRAQSHEFSYPETWMQFTPVAFHLGAAELGLKCECSFSERAVRATLAYATQTAICYTFYNCSNFLIFINYFNIRRAFNITSCNNTFFVSN